MPLVEVTYAPHIPEATLRKLADELPPIVSAAVECPEEPYDGDLQPGDVELRFRPHGPYDRCSMEVVIEVRSKYFESRARDRQQRTDMLHDRIAEVVDLEDFGVFLQMPVAAWTQSE
ncbi:hypothetical protein D5S18_11055 [Nocardia panacis]|uniref:Tautomerase family protein n=1 Tax=Nocardia panacis TaxID=2340916 RepID=A0A3A4K093_9NOCA|nr:hypothetical protein [Nocardia panacis]RJO77235.1 hypothetical protein D5S18_11055 [Nocardia panacis]